ncbi:MAG: M28 family peptidase [Spirochaetes bacterium]|jgi:hypothetical protein|nr:M28 family peptidase [Spirochaetota bacterium]
MLANALAPFAVISAGVSPDLRSHSRRSASDHTVFLEQGIDAVLFHTGLHADYHSVEDEANSLDYEHMARVIRTGAATVRRLPTQPAP